MRIYAKVKVLIIGVILLSSCGRDKVSQDIDVLGKDKTVEYYLQELLLGYWDLNYRFPISYLQARDTQASIFEYCTMMDSLLLNHVSEIKFTNQDTALLVTCNDDTLTIVHLPCSCNWDDRIPLGPRAYNFSDSLILDDMIQVSEEGYLDHLTHDLISELYPAIEKRMNKIGYMRVHDNEKRDPQYLLVEYLLDSDSIQLIKACEKYSFYFYDEYESILRVVFSEYCKKNHVSRLLTPVDIYLPVAEGSKSEIKH